MGVYSDFCRTRWRLRETSYSNESEATLEYGGWEAEYASRCLASSGSSHCLWLVAVDRPYSELLSSECLLHLITNGYMLVITMAGYEVENAN